MKERSMTYAWRALWALALFFGLVALSTPDARATPPVVVDETLDRTTPRRAFEGYMAAAEAGDYDKAAKYLDLRNLPRSKAAADGPELARNLSYVLQRKVTIDPRTIPDVADTGDKETVSVGSLYVGEDPVFINLTRVKGADGLSRWLIAKSTVAAVPQLDEAFGPKPWEERMPNALRSPDLFGNAPWQWVGLLFSLVLAIVIGRLLVAISFRATRPFLRSDNHRIFLTGARTPVGAILALFAFRGLTRALALTLDVDHVVERVTTTLLLLSFAMLSIRLLEGALEVLERTTMNHDEDGQRARSLRTQLSIFYRIAYLAVGVLALAAVLLQFDVVRAIGTSLLASAGVAGIILGLAAQKSIGAIFSGLQLSLAQSVRIGDVIVIDDVWGTVEQVNLTFVVVRLWDDRRLIVPVTRFLDKSFENWTKVGTKLKGEVVMHLDFLAPLDTIRGELEKLCSESPFWDGATCKLQVTDANDHGMKVRAVVSAKNADDLFDLRCAVREKLLAFAAGLEAGRHVPKNRLVLATAE